jgi:hydroxyacyl-ACP dehydratase HTD2-like protein with hotdog domain
VTRTEGYPERIVNGGLSALLVFDLAARQLEAPIAHATLRNVAPLFVNQRLAVCGRPALEHAAAASFWVTNHEGMLALSADIGAA